MSDKKVEVQYFFLITGLQWCFRKLGIHTLNSVSVDFRLLKVEVTLLTVTYIFSNKLVESTLLGMHANNLCSMLI